VCMCERERESNHEIGQIHATFSSTAVLVCTRDSILCLEQMGAISVVHFI